MIGQLEADDPLLQNSISRLRAMNIDRTEYTCLKAVAIFLNGPSCVTKQKKFI